MVCVHGAGVSSREFRPFTEILGHRHDTWTVDLPGFGASAGPRHPLVLRALADLLVEWLTAVDLDHVVLLGGSFGCQVAVDAAVRHPDRVVGMVLVGPTVDPAARPSSTGPAPRRQRVPPRYGALAVRRGVPEVTRMWWPSTTTSPTTLPVRTPGLRERWSDSAR
ncbi:alpha/beta hydrolase [Streptomyces sp. NPDC048665]|uniref:alpha/beta fold hydrolase n=1 Tax=unclassified Streptomyces TaxID=2593676 RepID=UPI00342A5993